MNKIVLSVHGLVDYALRSGDIDTRVFNIDTMTKGSQIHAYYQAKQNKRYLAEQYLSYTFIYDVYEVVLQGRVDGIIVNDNEIIIEEIKTTNSDIDVFFNAHEAWHLGQAKCYALMYALDHDLHEIDVQLTYISQIDDRKIIKRYTFTIEELTRDVHSYFAIYFSFYEKVESYINARNKDLKSLAFPFQKVRPSQKEMMDEVEAGLLNYEKRYFNAPTGSGKTMATLYPSLKRMGERNGVKIFYLTAKGSGKIQAENALRIINQRARVKSINLSAKEKMCLNDKIACNPDECPFARNYYGKLKHAILDIYMNYDEYTPSLILEIAKKHELCPFEFQLDLSLFCDVIIADYNYLFDPFVYLRRYFDQKQGEYIVLVDEAHNLGRRVNDNYSKRLDFSAFYSFRKTLKGELHKEVRRLINRIVKVLEEYSVDIIAPLQTINEFPAKLLGYLEKFLIVGSDYMQKMGKDVSDEFRDFFFDVNKFIKIHSLINNDFVQYVEIDEDKKFFPRFYIKCLNPETFINSAIKGIDHVIFFSATLAPENYYKTILGIENDIIHITNPFKKDQLLIMTDATVSLYYKDREKTLDAVVKRILKATAIKTGNYLVYTPSFAYLELLYNKLEAYDGFDLEVQKERMSDFEKEAYLEGFTFAPTKTKIGLAVLGGSFSEGVDLVSDRLSGIFILGVGYPPPSFEKELEKEYFDKILNDGVSYAYVYPALNKILQTMGRVIRTEQDHGFILLMDRRYNFSPYREHLASYNGVLKRVSSAEEIEQILTNFLLN
ncbi:MAG: ATP-dependent DNA helicase [Bacilli bacterium]